MDGKVWVYLGFVENLNFLQKALSSSGTDRVNMIAPSESDRTTRAVKSYMPSTHNLIVSESLWTHAHRHTLFNKHTTIIWQLLVSYCVFLQFLPRSLLFIMALDPRKRGPCWVKWYPNFSRVLFFSNMLAISISTLLPRGWLCNTYTSQYKDTNQAILYTLHKFYILWLNWQIII